MTTPTGPSNPRAGSEPASPRQRRFEARHRQLLAVALEIAEEEGWEALTTRRLATEIGYSQPVVYSHFNSREELVDKLALDGFEQLTDMIQQVSPAGHRSTTESVCRAYIEFGQQHPRLYEAMFTLTSSLPFASADTPAELREAFARLERAVAPDLPAEQAAAQAELIWACSHGLTTLLLARRIPPDRLDDHIRRIAAMTK